MERRDLTVGNSVGNASSYDTDVVEPTRGSLVVVFVANTRPPFFGPADTPTVTGAGLAWQRVETSTVPGDDFRLTCFSAIATLPTPEALTVDFAGATQDHCSWSVFEFEGVDGAGAAIAQRATKAISATSLALTLDRPSAAPAENLTVGGVVLSNVQPITAATGFTEIHEQGTSETFGKSSTLQTQVATSGVQTMSWSWGGGANAVAIVLEVNAATVVTPTPVEPPATFHETLARRFEPVLYFHRDEKFGPVNAKRFIEKAALWRTTAPLDDTSNWGGTPIVPATKLKADPTEAGGVFIGDIGGDQNLFLELGGWIDGAGTAEPDVSGATTNLYSNRAEISRLYQGVDPQITPWYHVEIVDGQDLVTFAARPDGTPDLTNTVEDLKREFGEVKLLCYYFFFPAHEQGVGAGGCDAIEAREVSSHAGDWQCFALLLAGDGSEVASAYVPKWIGLTGLLPATPLGETPRPSYHDADELTAMKVEAWQPDGGPTAGLPVTLDDDHARLYVGLGTHSLYLRAGTPEIVRPYPQGRQPQLCGVRDVTGPLPPTPNSSGYSTADEWWIFLTKLIAGLPFFPAAWIPGLVAAAIEGVTPTIANTQFGAEEVGDQSDPDVPPTTAGEGTVIRPVGVAVPGVPSSVVWQCARNREVDGRRYDFIVDRDAQRWWPNPELERGYLGRWGQQAAVDPFSRRSGPRFPDYPKMFLLALEDGRSRGTLAFGG